MNAIGIITTVAVVAVVIGIPLGFVLWCKKVYARRKEFWTSAADSLGLSFSPGEPSMFRGPMYSLEGEYNGYSIHVCLEIEGNGEDARGYTVYKLKCPETLKQRVVEGGLGGVIARVGESEVVFSDGDFKLRSNGYARSAPEIVTTVRELVNSVTKLEAPPLTLAKRPPA